MQPGRSKPFGTLRFDLDDQRRISLWYTAADRSVPVLRNAALGVWIGDTLTTLSDLQDVSVGNRRPPGGESLVLRGRTGAPAGSLWIEAEFLASESDARGAITVTLYPDRVLATIRGIRFCATSEPQVLPGEGALSALVNGYQSWSSCRLATLPTDATSYGALGLARGGRALGLVWDPGEPGEGKVKLSADGTIDALSEWLPGRPVRPDGDSATLRLAFAPGPSATPLAALSAAARPASSLDRERAAALAVPSGWCSWYELGPAVTEIDLLAHIDFCASRFDRRSFRYIQLDDGYQRAAGDWDTNDKFPHGHRWLTDRIHAAGFAAGLWIAPFAVAEHVELASANPVWLLKGPPPDAAPLGLDTRPQWGGRIYALDGAHPDVQQGLYDLAHRIVREWGYDYLKVDFLEWGASGTSHYGGLTRAEAYRHGLSAIREGLGSEAFLLGCGAPLQHAAGIVDGLRIGQDIEPSWTGIQPAARAAALRSFYHRSIWLNDPDCLVVRAPLTIDEARVWASLVAVSGGVALLSDNLPKLSPERLMIAQRALPVASQVASSPRPVALPRSSATPDRPAPAWVVEGARRWWTVVLVNWEDAPWELRQPLGTLGIAGSPRFAAYDVWADRPFADVDDTLTATIAPHATLTLALRPVAAHPQVVGSSRHVVQGAIDIMEERWEPRARALHGKSANLDSRPYAITIAVPPGFRARACRSDMPCTLKRVDTGHVRIHWPAGTSGEREWTVSFARR